MKRPGGGTAGRGRRREPGGAAGGREEHAPSSTYAKTAWRSAGAPGARGAHGRDAPAAARRAAGTVGRAGSGAPAPRPPRAPRPAEPAGPRRRAGADRAGRWRRRSPRREARAARCQSEALRRFGRRAGDRGAGALIATVAPGVVDFFFFFFCPPGSKHPRFNCLRLTCRCGSFPATSGAGGRAPVRRASCGDSCAHPWSPPTAPSDLPATKSEPRNSNGPAHLPSQINLLGEDRSSPLRDYLGRCPRRDR